MTRDYEVHIHCDHACGPVKHGCLGHVRWTPDGVNDTADGWHVDYEINAHIDDAEPEDICGPCWAQLEYEAITPHKEGE